MGNIKIYVYTHKDFKCPKMNPDRFVILNQDNNIVSNTKISQLHDNTGVHIDSQFNNAYCEIKGLYWIWKNALDDSDYIGLFHYRRFFDLSKPLVMNPNTVYIPKIIQLSSSIRYWYYMNHRLKDIDLIADILDELFPDKANMYKLFLNNTFFVPCNMFIMHKDVLNSYCEFLFSVLNRFMEIKGYNTYDDICKDVKQGFDNGEINYMDVPYQSRILGFISERLFTIWILTNHFNDIKQLNIVDL